jgi:hypothetical protein
MTGYGDVAKQLKKKWRTEVRHFPIGKQVF